MSAGDKSQLSLPRVSFFTMFLFFSPHDWLLCRPLPHLEFITTCQFSSYLVSFPYNESISLSKSVSFTTCQFFSNCVSFFTTCQMSLPHTSFTYTDFFHLVSVFCRTIQYSSSNASFLHLRLYYYYYYYYL
jgi:hypothetical protein